MNIEIFDDVIRQQLDLCLNTLVTKGHEYAPHERAADYDRLSDFKRAASIQNCTPAQALLGMMTKHIISIYRMVSDDEPCTEALWSEKITDAMNYLLILKAIVREEKMNECQGVSTEEAAKRLTEVQRIAKEIPNAPRTPNYPGYPDYPDYQITCSDKLLREDKNE